MIFLVQDSTIKAIDYNFYDNDNDYYLSKNALSKEDAAIFALKNLKFPKHKFEKLIKQLEEIKSKVIKQNDEEFIIKMIPLK